MERPHGPRKNTAKEEKEGTNGCEHYIVFVEDVNTIYQEKMGKGKVYYQVCNGKEITYSDFVQNIINTNNLDQLLVGDRKDTNNQKLIPVAHQKMREVK